MAKIKIKYGNKIYQIEAKQITIKNIKILFSISMRENCTGCLLSEFTNVVVFFDDPNFFASLHPDITYSLILNVFPDPIDHHYNHFNYIDNFNNLNNLNNSDNFNNSNYFNLNNLNNYCDNNNFNNANNFLNQNNNLINKINNENLTNNKKELNKTAKLLDLRGGRGGKAGDKEYQIDGFVKVISSAPTYHFEKCTSNYYIEYLFNRTTNSNEATSYWLTSSSGIQTLIFEFKEEIFIHMIRVFSILRSNLNNRRSNYSIEIWDEIGWVEFVPMVNTSKDIFAMGNDHLFDRLIKKFQIVLTMEGVDGVCLKEIDIFAY